MIIQELDPALMIYKKRDNDPASGSGFSIPANGSRPNLTLELYRELDPNPEGTIYKKKDYPLFSYGSNSDNSEIRSQDRIFDKIDCKPCSHN